MGKHHYTAPEIHVEDLETPVPQTVDLDVDSMPSVDEIEEAIDEVQPLVGVVTDCAKLNVRRAPSKNATVVCEIACDATVIIDEDKSNAEWYSVCTEAGVNGFCMKKYITLSR